MEDESLEIDGKVCTYMCKGAEERSNTGRAAEAEAAAGGQALQADQSERTVLYLLVYGN